MAAVYDRRSNFYDAHRAPLQKIQLFVRPSERGGRKFRAFPQTRAATTDFKHVCDLFGKKTFASLAFAPTRIVKLFAASRRTDPSQHFRFSLREMFVEPVLEQWRDGPRQS